MTTDTLSDRPRPGRKGQIELIAIGAAGLTTAGNAMAEILTCDRRNAAQ